MFVSARPSEATILHADLDAFFASVEQRDDPALRGRPVLVGGGVVLAASYEARAYGVRGAMGGAQARRLCPHAVIVPPRMSAYAEASKAVFDVFDRTSPHVEGLSIDEAFLEVSGLRNIAGSPTDIAARLRREVRERVGLPITVGVARTKFLAKVASGVAKPDGLLVVEPDAELDFLHRLSVGKLWGVGPVTEARLRDRGMHTVGDVARYSEAALTALLGTTTGRHLHRLAHNHDPRPVLRRKRRGSIGAQRALGRTPKTSDDIDAALTGLVERVCRRMRRADRRGRTVVLRLRFDDYTRATRSHTLAAPTARTSLVLATVRHLLREVMPRVDRQGLTLIGVAVANLSDEASAQLELPFWNAEARTCADTHSWVDVDPVLDHVRERFGVEAITRGTLLGRSPGVAMPTLPD
ncbi:DNA polymerase IV [Haloechinothrix salitolerans]|uniref:DNA polymerase IV n=1 Tax=Haloechinothrix salitolerans TaxID=926830 RepID=A0ABW2C3H4_9PSEU